MTDIAFHSNTKQRIITGQRLIILRLLNSFQWCVCRCSDVLGILNRTPVNKVRGAISTIKYFQEESSTEKVEIILEFFIRLNQERFCSLLNSPISDIIRAVEIGKYLDTENRILMSEIINDVSFEELLEVQTNIRFALHYLCCPFCLFLLAAVDVPSCIFFS